MTHGHTNIKENISLFMSVVGCKAVKTTTIRQLGLSA